MPYADTVFHLDTLAALRLLWLGRHWLAQLDGNVINRRLRHADAIIGCADYITDHVRTKFPHYAERCATVYNGTDLYESSSQSDELGKGRSGKRFIFLGRVSPEKGIHILVDAFKTVVAREPEAELVIIGGAHIPPLSFIVEQSSDPMVRDLRRFYTSDYLEYLRSQADGTIGDRISLVGYVPHNQLISYLRSADVLVQPSVWGEPFGMPMIEAMAAGLPVIASRAGGLRESVVDGKTGLLVDPNNPVALADAMLRVIAEKEMAHDMGAAGAARAKELFSWGVVAARLRSLYEALNSGRRPISAASAISIAQSSRIVTD
jgi:glycosyltransferase involved in cell wall biosynthesis